MVRSSISLSSGRDECVSARREAPAEVDTVHVACGVAREVALHALGRAVRDDVLVAFRGQERDREGRLLLRVFTFAQLLLRSDLRREPAVVSDDVDVRRNRLVTADVLL